MDKENANRQPPGPSGSPGLSNRPSTPSMPNMSNMPSTPKAPATAPNTAPRRSYTAWFSPFRRSTAVKPEPAHVPRAAPLDLPVREASTNSDRERDRDRDRDTPMVGHDGVDDSVNIDDSVLDGDTMVGALPAYRLPTPPRLERRRDQAMDPAQYQDEDSADLSLSYMDDDSCDHWAEYFEAEPTTDADKTGESEWEVDEDELAAYETGVQQIDGFERWTHDEKRLHRLLSLRGFHPLMPATWTRDFLGVPLYPSLFAPPERAHKQTLIYNKGSQFRATKALRNLFDLQVRVSGLRQSGNTRRIDGIIERELRRYIAWAAQDVGLDRCKPFVEMPNMAAKRFSQPGDSDVALKTPRSRRREKTLASRIEKFFADWAERYRQYYADLPPFPVKKGDVQDGIKVEEDEDEAGEQADREDHEDHADGQPTMRRLRPPRILYGFIIVQHVVMLLAVDAARPRARPRCFADFNMSLGGHWLDASLNVAIPVHMARAAQLRCVRGLALPVLPDADDDEDA